MMLRWLRTDTKRTLLKYWPWEKQRFVYDSVYSLQWRESVKHKWRKVPIEVIKK